MSRVPSERVVVPSLGSLVSTGSLRPVCQEPSLRRCPIGGIPSLGELWTFFFRSLLEGGDAQLILSWCLKKEMGLWLWGLFVRVRGTPVGGKARARAPSSLPALGCGLFPGPSSSWGPTAVALDTPTPCLARCV